MLNTRNDCGESGLRPKSLNLAIQFGLMMRSYPILRLVACREVSAMMADQQVSMSEKRPG